MLPTSLYPGFTLGLPMITAFKVVPPVHHFHGPGAVQRRACGPERNGPSEPSRPSFTSSRSFKTRSTSRGRIEIVGVVVAGVASVLNFFDIGLHHHVLRAGELLDGRTARAMIEMSVADQDDLDVPKFEAQLFHAGLNQRHRRFETLLLIRIWPWGVVTR